MDGLSVDTGLIVAIIALFGLLANRMYFEPKRAREEKKNEWGKHRDEREFDKKQEVRKEKSKNENSGMHCVANYGIHIVR